MKKMFSFAMVLIVLASCLCTTAFAEEKECEGISAIPQLVSSEYFVIEDMEVVQTRAHTTMSFTNLAKGYAKKSSSTYYITKGKDKLKVHSLTWTPAGQDISVAFINAQTGDTYAVGYSGGSVSNGIITTSTVPTGEYYVAIVNYDGPDAITGALSYSFI